MNDELQSRRTAVRRFLSPALGLFVLLGLGCDSKPAKRPRPGEPVSARVEFPTPWRHGADNEAVIAFTVQAPCDAGPVSLNAADFPGDFEPVIDVVFFEGETRIGPALEVPFDPDC